MSGRPDLGQQFDPDVVRLIADVAIVTRPDLWTDDIRTRLEDSLRTAYGRVPSLHDLAQRFGEELVREVTERTVRERVASLNEWGERNGIGSPCHFCGAARRENDAAYPFGLAHSVVTKTHWGGALATLAVNVISVPLGVVVAARPGQSTTAHIARCRLVMCQGCGPKCWDGYRGWIITERECRYHPSWRRLYQAGFTKFLNHEQVERFL